MSETYLRQWAMLRHIPRLPRKIPASNLLSLLEEDGYKVSKRTIERDLISLSEIFPLECDDRNKPFGWSWFGKDVFDIPSMDIPVALTFSLTSQFLKPLLPRSSNAHLEPHFHQAEKVLNNTQKSGQGKWLDKVRILHQGQKLIPSEIAPEILDTVYEALFTDKRLEITYLKRGDDEVSVYEVNPLGLVFRDATVYMVSSLWEYDEIKQLVLHRIKSAIMLDKSKRTPKDFNIDTYIDSDEFGYKVKEKPIKLKVLFDAQVAIHVQETPLSEDQVIKKQKDEQVLIEASVLDTLELRWWLMSFGDQIEVIKPKRLRQEFMEMAINLVEKYSDAT